MILIDICGSTAAIREQQALTCGMVGASVRFRLDAGWDKLYKTAVFRAGDVTRDVPNIQDRAEIPYEVLTVPGLRLEVGLYGANDDGTLVIPTIWAETEPIRAGADPSGDPGLEPTKPIWQQAVTRLEALDAQVGDIDAALDSIIAMEAELLGGESA